MAGDAGAAGGLIIPLGGWSGETHPRRVVGLEVVRFLVRRCRFIRFSFVTFLFPSRLTAKMSSFVDWLVPDSAYMVSFER